MATSSTHDATLQFPLQFPDPPLQALETVHAHFALRHGKALKYPRAVTPFSALLENSPEALADLQALMEPGESTYIVAATPPPGAKGPFGVVQMTWPAALAIPGPPPSAYKIEPLTCADAPAMVALTDVAFPGFFRTRTCEMGQYYGIRDDSGELIAMCGERMAIHDQTTGDRFHEISGLCTHPAHRGKGLAHLLMTQLLHDHRAAGIRSYLHASNFNTHAIAMYARMGFEHRGQFPLCRIPRPA